MAKSTSGIRPAVCSVIALILLVDAFRAPPAARAALEVDDLGKTYAPVAARLIARQREANPGGSTSVRNIDLDHLEWKAGGYYQRNRDLGQVITADRDVTIEAIVLRTGPSDSAVLAGAPGAEVFIQLFEVTGSPRINDNGTPPGAKARHGFSTNHRCDDYLEGVRYKPLRVVKGGVFPKVEPTQTPQGKPSGEDAGKLRYLRWRLTGDDALHCKVGKRYAFMVGFVSPGPERGFTLANANSASVNAPPSLTDRHDHYHGGWGLRREGNGKTPPTMIPAQSPPAADADRKRLLDEAFFPAPAARFDLPPTTDGYPDVDTYRDLEFYLESAPAPPQPGAAPDDRGDRRRP